ncbi:MAG TPA: hypothetical protein VGX26_09145 [Solirubrobacteraceae bacterium]|jgi:ATP-dependent Zn protease|nr:hypothetical protein [Solirubrobacteraceae bacterium]
MNRTVRSARRAAVLAMTLALALVTAASATGAVHFTHESFGAFEKQLAAGQIHAATFNKKAHTLHLSMNDGRHLLVSYPSHEEPQLAAKLAAKGVPVAVEKKAKPKAAVHHTLRYVAGGIVVIVIIVVAAVLLVDRRRKLGEEAAGTASPQQSQPPE